MLKENTDTLSFAKMEGCGNDFVVIDALRHRLPEHLNFCKLADRHAGVGCDQILILQAPDKDDDADFIYRIINADGGEVGQCGNGARCAHYFLRRAGLTDKRRLRLRTTSVAITTELRDGGRGRAYLGAPMFAPDHIPLCRQSAEFYTAENINGSFAALSLGNPHAVFFVDDIKTTELRQTGASLNLETDVFPQGVNVGFCVIGDKALRLRVYERGVGETKSCGSGATAAAVVAIKNKGLPNPVSVAMSGGELLCGWVEDGEAWLEGEITHVFDGVLDVAAYITR